MLRRAGLLVSALALLVAGLALPGRTAADDPPLILPLENYPIDDACGAWGFYNPNFARCGQPGKHVADDACAPAGTPVYAIADGVVQYAAQVGNCFSNWGWLTVVEHTREDGSKFCSIYGHCRPETGVLPGLPVTQGQHIAKVEFPCGAQHIHFGIAIGSYGIGLGGYPSWLAGYLPEDTTCTGYANPFPGRYVDPVAYVQASVAVMPASWSTIKTRVR
jgi:murein DD-endopeptidase MepM/ murein hydrolase activator NlpD